MFKTATDRDRSPLASSSGQVLAPLADLGWTLFLHIPTVIASESMKLAERQLNLQDEFLRSLRRCKTFADVAKAQADFMQEAVWACSEEAAEVAEEFAAAAEHPDAA